MQKTLKLAEFHYPTPGTSTAFNSLSMRAFYLHYRHTIPSRRFLLYYAHWNLLLVRFKWGVLPVASGKKFPALWSPRRGTQASPFYTSPMTVASAFLGMMIWHPSTLSNEQIHSWKTGVIFLSEWSFCSTHTRKSTYISTLVEQGENMDEAPGNVTFVLNVII